MASIENEMILGYSDTDIEACSRSGTGTVKCEEMEMMNYEFSAPVFEDQCNGMSDLVQFDGEASPKYTVTSIPANANDSADDDIQLIEPPRVQSICIDSDEDDNGTARNHPQQQQNGTALSNVNTAQVTSRRFVIRPATSGAPYRGVAHVFENAPKRGSKAMDVPPLPAPRLSPRHFARKSTAQESTCLLLEQTAARIMQKPPWPAVNGTTAAAKTVTAAPKATPKATITTPHKAIPRATTTTTKKRPVIGEVLIQALQASDGEEEDNDNDVSADWTPPNKRSKSKTTAKRPKQKQQLTESPNYSDKMREVSARNTTKVQSIVMKPSPMAPIPLALTASGSGAVSRSVRPSSVMTTTKKSSKPQPPPANSESDTKAMMMMKSIPTVNSSTTFILPNGKRIIAGSGRTQQLNANVLTPPVDPLASPPKTQTSTALAAAVVMHQQQPQPMPEAISDKSIGITIRKTTTQQPLAANGNAGAVTTVTAVAENPTTSKQAASDVKAPTAKLSKKKFNSRLNNSNLRWLENFVLHFCGPKQVVSIPALSLLRHVVPPDQYARIQKLRVRMNSAAYNARDDAPNTSLWSQLRLILFCGDGLTPQGCEFCRLANQFIPNKTVPLTADARNGRVTSRTRTQPEIEAEVYSGVYLRPQAESKVQIVPKTKLPTSGAAKAAAAASKPTGDKEPPAKNGMLVQLAASRSAAVGQSSEKIACDEEGTDRPLQKAKPAAAATKNVRDAAGNNGDNSQEQTDKNKDSSQQQRAQSMSLPKNTDRKMCCQRETERKCVICQHSVPSIVPHYVNEHPDCEVYVARLSERALNHLADDSEAIEARLRSRGACQALCVFCGLQHAYEPTDWHEHYTMYTGEFAYRCSECGQRHWSRRMALKHVGWQSPCRAAGGTMLEDSLYDWQIGQRQIAAHLCEMCNYTQLQRRNVLLHLRTQHGVTKSPESLVKRIVLLHIPSNMEGANETETDGETETEGEAEEDDNDELVEIVREEPAEITAEADDGNVTAAEVESSICSDAEDEFATLVSNLMNA